MKVAIAALACAALVHAPASAQVMIERMDGTEPRAQIARGVVEPLVAGDSAAAARFLLAHAAEDADAAVLLRQLGEMVAELRARPGTQIHSYAGSPSTGDMVVLLMGGGRSVRMVLTDEPFRVRRLGLAMLPVPAVAPISPEGRRSVLDSLYAVVQSWYVSPDTARLITAYLRERAEAGAYDGHRDTGALAEALTRDMRAINGDLHLSVRPSADGSAAAGPVVSTPGTGPATAAQHDAGASGAGAPPRADRGGALRIERPDPSGARPAPAGQAVEAPLAAARAVNSDLGFGRAVLLEGDVGYVELLGVIGGTPFQAAALDATVDALVRVAGASVVILDLRAVMGGSGIIEDPTRNVHHMLVSHFLPPDVHVLNEYLRATDLTTAIRTRRDVPGPRRLDVPIYVLTSARTASAGEWIAFVLQSQGRATIVGENTAGAGRAVRGVRLGHGLSAGVSVSRTWDPQSGAGFEGIGVRPDIAVPADEALDRALQLARSGRPDHSRITR